MKKKQKIKHWKNIFDPQQNSGSSIILFCRDKNISASTFYAWRKRLSGEAVKPQQVIPFVIHEQSFTQSSMIKIITPKGYQIDFDSTLTPSVLADLLEVL